jgi:hypothetical protein
MSLLYGCIYIIRFGMMRSTCRAAEWAHVSYDPKKYDYRILLIACFFLGSPEDDDKHFLERLGVSSDASNMASMVSRSSLGIKYHQFPT